MLGEWKARFRRAREHKPRTPVELDAEARAELRRSYEAVCRDFLKPGCRWMSVPPVLHEELDDGGWRIDPTAEGMKMMPRPE